MAKFQAKVLIGFAKAKEDTITFLVKKNLWNTLKQLLQIFEELITPFFHKQSIFDPHPENCLSLLTSGLTNFYCLNIQTF